MHRAWPNWNIERLIVGVWPVVELVCWRVVALRRALAIGIHEGVVWVVVFGMLVVALAVAACVEVSAVEEADQVAVECDMMRSTGLSAVSSFHTPRRTISHVPSGL